jgi:serine/threonine-protein kinase
VSHIADTTGRGAEDADPFDGTSFRAVRRVARAGQNEVFLVAHRVTGRQFTAKLGPPGLADAPQVDRMRVEAQALGRLEHPNIVAIRSVGRTGDQRFFLVTELLEGTSLADEIAQRGPFSVAEAITYACDLLSALSAAHGLGVVHRAVSPGAILLCGLPDERRVLKLCDFGLVRVLPQAPPQAPRPPDLLTDSGVVVGTPGFVSPEAASGMRADTRSDLYSAALVLYSMLAGRGLFDHLSLAQRFAAQSAPALGSLSGLTRGPVPRELERVLLQALEPDPDKRFQTAEEFRRSLGRIADDLVRPAAWLETTQQAPLVFELAAAEDEVATRGQPESAPRVLDAAPAPAMASLSDEPGPRVPAAQLLAADSGEDERRRRLVLLFQLTALVAGVLAGTVTFFVEGGLR